MLWKTWYNTSLVLLFGILFMSCSGERVIAPVAGRDYYDGKKEGVELSDPNEDYTVPTATFTPKPGPTWTPTKTPRPAPTWTPTKTPQPPTPRPTNTPVSVACSSTGGLFANLWIKYQDRLGCSLSGWNSDRSYPPYNFGEMPFQGGHMFVFMDDKDVYVAYGSGGEGWTGTGKWETYPLTWQEGDPDFSCPQENPYPQQPIQGFGEVWCKFSQVRQGLGWGTNRMRDQDRESPGAQVYRLQVFENGFIFRDSDGWTHDLAYIFFDNSEYVRTSYR